MEIVALLTGKGSSTLKNKNLLKINNHPILWYPCSEAKKVKEINKFFVSSEDKKIINTCKKYGFEPIKRPRKLAKANSQHIDVLVHAINFMKNNNCFPDIIIVLLANAPIIKKKWISDCINILKKNKKITAAAPVVIDNDHNPYRAKIFNGKHLLNFIKSKRKLSSNRQDLPNSYFFCHNFWVLRTKEIIKSNGYPPWNFMGKRVKPYKIKKSVDIHNMDDFNLAKILLKNN